MRPNNELYDAIKQLASGDEDGARNISAAIAVAAAHLFYDGQTAPVDAWAKTRSEPARAGALAQAKQMQRGNRDARHLAAEAIASATHKPGSIYYGGTAKGALDCANEYFYAALTIAGGKALADEYERRLLQAIKRRQSPIRIGRHLLDGLDKAATLSHAK